MVRAGANEVLTYSFVHGDMIKYVGQNVDNSYRVVNSISPDLQYYRQSLSPSLMTLVNPNIRQGNDSFALFEINKTHLKQDGMTDEGVPVESNTMAFIYANKNARLGAPYYQAKRFFEYICFTFNIDVKYSVIKNELKEAITMPFEPRRSAQIIDRKN